MSEIHVNVTDQLLKVVTAPILASGGINETKVVFNFCTKWNGFIKTAIFYRNTENIYYAVLDENDTCILPWEVYAEDGTFYISVFGENNDIRRTSTIVRYKVGKGIVAEELLPSEPTPEVYDQIIQMYQEIKELVQSGGGGTAEGAVLYTRQDLTYLQQKQARENIGAADADEIADLRRDYDGVIHETAGSAVRKQINDLYNEIDELAQSIGGGDSPEGALIVTLDHNTDIASHNAGDIFNAVNQGRAVVLADVYETNTELYRPTTVATDRAIFMMQTDDAGTFIYTIADDGSFEHQEVYFATTSYVGDVIDNTVGNIETALDSILAIQNELIGGDA